MIVIAHIAGMPFEEFVTSFGGATTAAVLLLASAIRRVPRKTR